MINDLFNTSITLYSFFKTFYSVLNLKKESPPLPSETLIQRYPKDPLKTVGLLIIYLLCCACVCYNFFLRYMLIMFSSILFQCMQIRLLWLRTVVREGNCLICFFLVYFILLFLA